MINKTQNFIFKGMLLNSELEALEETGIITKETPSLEVSIKNENPISIEDFSPLIRLNSIKMSSVYMAFYCFENSVRDLIKERLKERIGSDWWIKAVPTKIKDEVKKRQNKDSKNKWHAPRASDEISYTDFGDMSNIICSQWEHFEDLFPSQDWIRTRIGDLEQSRNAIAHNNPLEERDINRIKMYLDDWVKQVG